MGRDVFSSCFLTWGQTTVEVKKILVTSFKRSHAGTATLSAPDPASRPPPTRASAGDSWVTYREVWVSRWWGHCSCLLGPGVHTVLFVPCKSLIPQTCVSSGGCMVGLMATSSKRAYAIPRSTAPRAPAPVAGPCWPVPLQETLKHSSGSVSVESPGAHKVCLSPLSVSDGYGVWF